MPIRADESPVAVSLRGEQLIESPLLNKGTAFSDAERSAFGLHGLLPPVIETLERQAERAYDAIKRKPTDMGRYIYLRQLQDTNEVLFQRLMVDHVEEMMPIAYTPTVGAACQQFSEIYRRPRGLFISYPLRDRMDEMFASLAGRKIGVIVVTDGERILGLGDQGAGGMGIPIGKLALYSACGGIDPELTLPITLDCGTNNQERLADPTYIGWRHERVTGDDYYAFVDQFVQAVKRHLPDVLLQWEDFAQPHAEPLLRKYRDQLCTFNDDIQGTAAVTTAAIIAAVKSAGRDLAKERVCIVGAGSAGCGIAEQMIAAMVDAGADPKAARASFFMIDRPGLLSDKAEGLMAFQQKLVQPHNRIAGWAKDGKIGLAETVAGAKPTVLIGVSGQPGLFTEAIVKSMAANCDRPAILPLSNPTSRCEAKPADLIAWTEGRALIATGSPFAPVAYSGKSYVIGQSNNAYIFPGMGLAVLAVGAKRVTEGMMMKAALALADLAPSLKTPGAALVPPVGDIRAVSRHIALAVAKQAEADGHARPNSDAERAAKIDATMWTPHYREFKPAS